MKPLLLRTGSFPVHHHSFVPGSPRTSLTTFRDSISGALSGGQNGPASPRISMHSNSGGRRKSTPAKGIRRVSSESDVIRSENQNSGGFSTMNGVGWQNRIPENGVPVEELGFQGGAKSGSGGGCDDCRCFTSGNDVRRRIDAHYKEMLKSDPTNSLLLRNYAWFLHEVERDMVRAEEYYGRAILASPADGELLSLYGNLIWETHRDQDRAMSYFDRAIRASPDDCTVLGSYAHFMWEAEEEDDKDGNDDGIERENHPSAAIVEAF